MAKINTQFRTKTPEKPYPFGPHIPIAHIRETPPPQGDVKLNCNFKRGWLGGLDQKTFHGGGGGLKAMEPMTVLSSLLRDA